MVSRQKVTMAALLLISFQICIAFNAAQAEKVLKVGISPFSPFVILSDGEPAGMTIDLWQSLSREINAKYEYVVCEGVADKLKRLEEGRIDIAIGGITITEERESKFDFTHPVYNTGLDILIPIEKDPTFFKMVASMFEGKKLVLFVGLGIMILIAGNLIWLVERSSRKRTTSFHHNYFPGVFEGMYWVLITASTIGYGDKVPKRWIGRILAAIIIIIFLPLFGYFIAQLSSDLTMQSLKSNINRVEDLWGRKIAVVEGTTSHEYMRRMHAFIYTFNNVEDSISALQQGKVDAVVYDAPNLLFYANGEGKGKFRVVGKIFEPQDYGLALPQGSPLRELINRKLLRLVAADETENIQKLWFGE